MSFHKQVEELTEWMLRSEPLDHDRGCPDPHKILACVTGEDDVYELMANIPEDKIGEVLAWAMNVDIQLRA